MFTGDKFDNNQPPNVKARRINADISEINVNPGGTLRVLLTAVNGTGAGQWGSGSGFLDLAQPERLPHAWHEQCAVPAGFPHIPALMGSLSRLMAKSAGKRVFRIADSIGWQMGRFGGQALDWLSDQQRPI